MPKAIFPFFGACFFHFFFPHSQRGCKRPLLLPLLVLFATFDLLSAPFPLYEATGPFSLSPRPKLQRQGLSVLNLSSFFFRETDLRSISSGVFAQKGMAGREMMTLTKCLFWLRRKADGIFFSFAPPFFCGGEMGRKFRFNELC